MNATVEEYDIAYESVNNTILHSYGMKVCSLEEQLDQVRWCYIHIGYLNKWWSWGKTMGSRLEDSEFGPQSDVSTDFSVHRLKPSFVEKLKL
jgi:hypothetical protein